jgi:NADH-quinone oxidoreductase subunit G
MNLDDVLAACRARIAGTCGGKDAAPSAAFRIAGAKIPRSPHRESGRTAVLVNINVSEPAPPEDPDSPLSFSMEGTPDSRLRPHSVLLVARVELHSGGQYLSERGRRTLAWRRCGHSHLRARPANGQPYFSAIPAAFEPRDGEWLLVPIHHIFGSDELSLSAPGIAELAAKPHVAMNSGEFTENRKSKSLRRRHVPAARAYPSRTSSGVLPGYLRDCLRSSESQTARVGKDREAEMTSPYPILSISELSSWR